MVCCIQQSFRRDAGVPVGYRSSPIVLLDLHRDRDLVFRRRIVCDLENIITVVRQQSPEAALVFIVFGSAQEFNARELAARNGDYKGLSGTGTDDKLLRVAARDICLE